MAAPASTNRRQFAVRRLMTPGLIATGNPPTVAPGPGAGNGNARTLSDSRDAAGALEVQPAGAPAPGDVVCTVRFGSAASAPPKSVALVPANAASAALPLPVFADVDGLSREGFVVRSGASPLPAAARLVWFYCVTW